MKICKECGKEFEPKNPKGLFCSDACRQKDYRKKVSKELNGYRNPLSGSAVKQVTPSTAKFNLIKPEPAEPSKRSVEGFLAWKKDCLSQDEYETLLAELETADLTTRQKSLIKNA